MCAHLPDIMATLCVYTYQVSVCVYLPGSYIMCVGIIGHSNNYVLCGVCVYLQNESHCGWGMGDMASGEMGEGWIKWWGVHSGLGKIVEWGGRLLLPGTTFIKILNIRQHQLCQYMQHVMHIAPYCSNKASPFFSWFSFTLCFFLTQSL